MTRMRRAPGWTGFLALAVGYDALARTNHGVWHVVFLAASTFWMVPTVYWMVRDWRGDA